MATKCKAEVDELRRFAVAAKAGCPVSQAFGGVEISLA
jgi:hypothetical protein